MIKEKLMLQEHIPFKRFYRFLERNKNHEGVLTEIAVIDCFITGIPEEFFHSDKTAILTYSNQMVLEKIFDIPCKNSVVDKCSFKGIFKKKINDTK